MSVEINKKAVKEISVNIEQALKEYRILCAAKTADKLTKKAQESIRQFYADYPPKVYDRTFELLKNSYKRYYKNNGRTVYAGVEITSQDMSPYETSPRSHEYTVSPTTVAQLGWHGFHGDPTGYNGRFEPIVTPAPLEKLKKYYQSRSFQPDVEAEALKILQAKYK